MNNLNLRKIVFYLSHCLIILVSFFNIQNSADAQIFQTLKETEALPVEERMPPELIAKGIALNGFLIQPKISFESHYDSNIYAEKHNKDSDFYFSVNPSLNIFKEYKKHEFLFSADTKIDRFLEAHNENSEEYSAAFSGNISGNSMWQFPFSFSHRKRIRLRELPLITSIPDERLDINVTKTSLGISKRFNRLSISLLGNYSSVNYEDGIALDKVTPVIYSDNDRERYGGLLKFRYDFPRDSKGINAEHVFFANLIYGDTTYKKREFRVNSFSGPKGDFKEHGFLMGFKTKYKGFLFADIGAGLKHQSFEDSQLKDTNTAEILANVSYNIVPKLTLNFQANREINQDGGLVQGVVISDYGFGADYELLHDLYLGMDFGYTNYEFDTLNREDKDLSAILSMRKLHTQNLETALEVGYRDRQSNTPDRKFERYEMLLRLIGKL